MDRRWFRRRNRRSSNTSLNSNSKKYNIRFFSLDTLRIATNNFSTLLGEGGYGQVYKGILPDDGKSIEIAIKRLRQPSRVVSLEMLEFISHHRHINLIQLLGCCLEKNEQLLVFEYAVNRSVSHLLHSSTNSSVFNWERRAAVCIGIARGLNYLHHEITPTVIHCDIKPSNILLDANFNPKISDFDLIEFVDGSDKSTGRRNTIKGTMGYIAPEYVISGQLTQKSDVYGFGLTMLEIITGRKGVDLASKEVDDQWIMSWIVRMKKEDDISKIVDPKLTNFPKQDAERFINVAILCTQANSEQRPKMFQVVHMLYGGHKSDQEISEMANAAIVAQPEEWFSDNNSTQTSVSMSSLSIEMTKSGKCETKSVAEVAEMRSGNCSKEEDVVGAYFERSMEKIMRFQLQVYNASSRRREGFAEAVYPPFLSGEYRRPSPMRRNIIS